MVQHFSWNSLRKFWCTLFPAFGTRSRKIVHHLIISPFSSLLRVRVIKDTPALIENRKTVWKWLTSSFLPFIQTPMKCQTISSYCFCCERGDSMCNPVADPDLQMKGGGGHPDPEIRGGGAGLQKGFFQPFDPPFGLKIRGGPRPTRPLPLIRHCIHSIGDVFICKVKITCF